MAINPYACYGIKTLKKVTIGKYVQKIGTKAFYGCSGITNIQIKSSKLIKTSRIGAKAFLGTSGTMKIYVPKSKIEKYKQVLTYRGDEPLPR